MNKPLCKILDDIETVSDTINLRKWLQIQVHSSDYQLEYFLAHADDGIIWGYFDTDDNLVTPTEPEELFSNFRFPLFRYETLQQCRVFGKNEEILVWKGDTGLKARLVKDHDDTKFIKEEQILWGTQVEQVKSGFTLVSDGSQGLHHAIPLTDIEFDSSRPLVRPLRLLVNHYIHFSQVTGVARIYLSRLVSVKSRRIINAKTHS